MAKKQRDLFDELQGTPLKDGKLVIESNANEKFNGNWVKEKFLMGPPKAELFGNNPFSEKPVDPFKKTDRQIILGNIPSKSNCYRIITFRSKDPNKHPHASLAKTPELKKYEDSFYLQCNQYRNKNIEGFFELEVDVFFQNQRSDLDNSLKVLLDCLQTINAFPNDNRCAKIVAEKYLDKDNPRIEFSLKERQIKD